MDLAKQILPAVERHEFVLHYQPKVDMVSGRIVGAEALVRWRHPVEGLLPPSRFLASAEQNGAVIALGRWVRNAVIRFAARVNRDRRVPLRFAANASVVELADGGYLSSILHTLALHQCDPAWLIVEVTESVRDDEASRLLATLRALRSLGIGVALDDFGTGYSCLARLLDWPLSEIKIDRRFVCDLPAARIQQAVVRHTIGIAQQLGLTVVAEGVETHAQRNLLGQMGCPEGQGFLFGRPQDESTFLSLLAAGDALAPVLRPPFLVRSV